MNRQRGVALITVLMVFFFASTIAVAMISRQHLDIRRTANLFDSVQAAAYARGVEDFAIQLLREDSRDAPDVDHLQEQWAQQNLRFPVEYGEVIFSVADLQGRFNLNALAGEHADLALHRLRLLLGRLEIDPALADAIRDWLDADAQQSGYGGAEDNEYLLLDPPYRAANAAMRDISELRLVRGVDPQVYARLAPFVSALPADAGINVNSADPFVLQTLSQDLGPLEAEQIDQVRSVTPFTAVDQDFVSQQFVPATVNTKGLTVNSAYFLVRIEARFGERRALLETRVHRAADGHCQVLDRNFSRTLPVAPADPEGAAS